MKLLTQGRLVVFLCVGGLALISCGIVLGRSGPGIAFTLGGAFLCLVSLGLTRTLISGVQKVLDEYQEKQASVKAGTK